MQLVTFTLKHRKIKIRSETSYINRFYPQLVFDKRRLQQVLLNLLTNAIKFQKNGVIKVKAEIEREKTHRERELTLSVMVLDQGIGLEAEELSKIFDPFWRSKR